MCTVRGLGGKACVVTCPITGYPDVRFPDSAVAWTRDGHVSIVGTPGFMDEVQLARIDWELQLLFSPAPDSVVFPKLGISYDTN
ncbi:MAG: hypothetical protein QOH93_3168, partial [Chloroflexia bacterium]|nr:hypothetical protein [Chloroflexia bacterium]